jgi:hypothetical protein
MQVDVSLKRANREEEVQEVVGPLYMNGSLILLAAVSRCERYSLYIHDCDLRSWRSYGIHVIGQRAFFGAAGTIPCGRHFDDLTDEHMDRTIKFCL